MDKGYPNDHLLANPDWLQAHLAGPNLRIMDLRPLILYQRGHIPGAVHLEIERLHTVIDGVPEIAAPLEVGAEALGAVGIDENTTVVAYDNVGGLVAARFFWILEYYSHPDVRVLDGGSDRWSFEGREITREVPQVQPKKFMARPRPEVLVDRKWILENLGQSDLVLLDTRSPGEYNQNEWGPGLEEGHLPGALNLEWSEALEYNPVPGFKVAEEVQSLLENMGVTPGKDVVTYCQTGSRSSHTYFVLRLLGYPRVRHYDGSWVDWVIRVRRGE